ncbi:MAG: hypothetical protein JXR29_13130 [Methylothermaceae bacterium]|nr:hypothetical protein [Methylothermaceae bacterium]
MSNRDIEQLKELVPEEFWEERDWRAYDRPAIERKEGGSDRLREIREDLERKNLASRMREEETMALFMGSAA